MTGTTNRSLQRQRGGTMFTKKLMAALTFALLAALTVPLASPASAQTSITLCATTGSVTMPDGVVVPIWGYALGSCGAVAGTASLPGPEIHVTEGDSLAITLENDLTEAVSIVVPTVTGAPDLLGAPAGGSTSYSWSGGQLSAGTHLYESGMNPGVQVPMGLYGALVVTPAGGVADVDQVVLMSEVDVDLNAAPGTFNRNDYAPEYYLINGQAAPDIPGVAAAAGQTVRLRYLNAGSTQLSMSILGARQTVVAKEGRSVPLARDVVTELVPSGHTVDTEIAIDNSHAGTQIKVYNRNGRLTNDAAPGSGGGLQLGIDVAAGSAPEATTYISLNCPNGSANTCDEDIDILRDNGDGTLSVVFDGSGVLLPGDGANPSRTRSQAMIDGFAFLSPNEILISFQRPLHRTLFGLSNVPGRPAVIDDSDVMLYTTTAPGQFLTGGGTWSWYFEGSDVGLSLGREDIDAVEIDPATGDLLLSTVADADVPGPFTFPDEDVFRFTFSGPPGHVTSGTFSPYIDGSEIDGALGTGLKLTSEDIDAFSLDPDNSNLHLSTLGNIWVGENAGTLFEQDHDVVTCIADPGPFTGCTDWEVLLQGNDYNLQAVPRTDIKGVEVSSVVLA